ncbi:MAG: UbiD family decarboxylase domain-containing protein, partial [Solirubrobacteraceae bacterium]
MPQSLRWFLTELERAGELIRVAEPVSLRYELSALLASADDGPALLFEHVVGSELPVVGGVMGSRARIAAGVGVPVEELQERIVAAVHEPLSPRALDGDAPCQEVCVEDPDLAQLPIPWFFEHETGPYVTAGAIAARDPETGAANLSIARLKPLGGSRALAGIAPNHHLAVLGRAAAARGEPLPIAVTIGNHPAILLASCLYLELGADELECAGALLGEPVQVALTARGLAVPAHCELVLE